MEFELKRKLVCDQGNSQVIESDIEEDNIVEKPIKIPGESEMLTIVLSAHRPGPVCGAQSIWDSAWKGDDR